MCSVKKKMKILVILNIIILTVMFLVCFINQPSNIPGVCDECSTETFMIYNFATVIFAILAILAVIICCIGWNVKSKWKCITILVLSSISILFSLIEGVIFLSSPNVGWHEDMTKQAIKMVDMLDIQFIVARIICIVLMIWNGAIVGFSIYGIVQCKKDKCFRMEDKR